MRPALSPSRLMAHASDSYHVTGVPSWLMAHASDSYHVTGVPSWLMRHASCVRLMRPAHASCVMRPAHASCVRLMRPAHASGSCVRLMRPAHASCVRLMRHASDSYHVTASIQSLSFSHRRPLSVMTTTGTAAIYPCANAPRFAPVGLYGIG